METENLQEQPITEPVVEQTPETVAETPQAEPTPEATPETPAPQPTVAPVIEPDYSPAAVAARLKDDDLKVLLKEKGYSDFLIDALEYGQRTGGDLAAYWEAKHIDWTDKTRISDEKVMELKLKEQYAGSPLTEAQVQKLVQRDLKQIYMLGDDFDTESEEVEVARLKLQMDAYKVRNEKAQQQAQFRAPEPQQPEQPIAPEVVQEQVKQRLLADSTVQGFLQNKAVKFGDYAHTVENPEAALQVLTNQDYYNSLNYLKDAQGNVVVQNGEPVLNTQRLLKLALYAQDMDGIEQKLIAYGKAQGRKAVEDEAEVIPQRETGTPTLPSERTVFDALLEKTRGK